MNSKWSTAIILLTAAVGTLALVLLLIAGFLPASRKITETVVAVTKIQQSDSGEWSIPKDAAADQLSSGKTFVMRLRHLRAERVEVEVFKRDDHQLLIRSEALTPGDLLVRNPEGISMGQALAPISGLDEELFIALLLEAGIAAAMAENVDESLRFLAADYRDNSGFNLHWLRLFLRRAYKEFDAPGWSRRTAGYRGFRQPRSGIC